MMISMVRFVHKCGVLALAFLLTFDFWCGGFANASAMLTGMRAVRVSKCKHERVSTRAKEGPRHATFPRVFRSPVFLTEGAHPPPISQDPVGFTALHWNVPELFTMVVDFHAAPQSLPDKISPHVLYSVLNL